MSAANISFLDKVKKIVGFEDFSDPDRIIQFLKNFDKDEDFSDAHELVFEKSRIMNLWLISSKNFIYVIRDKGYGEFTVLLKRDKNNFNFEIIRDNNAPRLYINDTITTLPIDTSITGGTSNFEAKVKQLVRA